MSDDQVFTLTDEHLTLLRAAYIGWEDCEFGAPAIDCKRPVHFVYVCDGCHRALIPEDPHG